MRFLTFKRSAKFGCLLTLMAAVVGCGQPASDSGSPQVSEASHEDHDHDEGDGHGHGGYWCGPHGVPEKVCSGCITKVADEFKAKGDWCEEHNRAESQCFKCDPARAEKFAALYEAKFGKKPPAPTE